MEVARIVHSILPMIDVVARKGNSNAVTDACVAMMCARTAILGALLNVRINLTSIKDEKFVKEMTEEADMIENDNDCRRTKRILDYVKIRFLKNEDYEERISNRFRRTHIRYYRTYHQ